MSDYDAVTGERTVKRPLGGESKPASGAAKYIVAGLFGLLVMIWLLSQF